MFKVTRLLNFVIWRALSIEYECQIWNLHLNYSNIMTNVILKQQLTITERWARSVGIRYSRIPSMGIKISHKSLNKIPCQYLHSICRICHLPPPCFPRRAADSWIHVSRRESGYSIGWSLYPGSRTRQQIPDRPRTSHEALDAPSGGNSSPRCLQSRLLPSRYPLSGPTVMWKIFCFYIIWSSIQLFSVCSIILLKMIDLSFIYT